MKIEDVKQFVFEVAKGTGEYDGHETPDSVWEGLDDVGRLFLTDLVNAAEQRGIERAKAGVTMPGTTNPEEYLDWSTLDAEIAKERAERAKFFGGRYDEANGFQPLDKVSAYPKVDQAK